MNRNGIPVRYHFENRSGDGDQYINVIHTTHAPVVVPGHDNLPQFEIHSSTSHQYLKNKTLTDKTNHIVANSLRTDSGDLLIFPDVPNSNAEVVLTLSNGKLSWQQSNDDKIRGKLSAIDKMTGTLTAAIESLSQKVDTLEKRLQATEMSIAARVDDLEEAVDIETNRATLSKLRADISIIMDVIDGLTPDSCPENGVPMTAKLAKSVISESNPIFANGDVFVKGKLSHIIGGLCRLSANNNISSKN